MKVLNQRTRLIIYSFLIIITSSYLFSFFSTSSGVDKYQFILLNLFLFFYLMLEGLTIFKRDTYRPFLHPTLLVIMLFYFMMHLIPNLRLILSDPIEHLPVRMIIFDEPYKSFNKTMLLLILSAFTLLLGYKANLSQSIALNLKRSVQKISTFTNNRSVGLPVIILIIFLGIVSLVAQINLGIYGYAVSDEIVKENANTAQMFRYIDQAQLLCLMILAFSLHSSKDYQKNRQLIFFFLLIFLCLQGFLFGSKGKVLFPFMAAGIAAYAYTGRIVKTYIFSAFLVFIIAFITIEPYRVVKNLYPDSTFKESIALLREVPEILEMETIEEDITTYQRMEDFSFWLIGRSDNFSFSANAIEFKDRYGIPDNNTPDFLGSIIYSPVLAYVPRFIWKNKPRDQIGAWYEDTIMQSNFYSATAFGAIGYCYYAGGVVMVALVFLFFGFCQRIIYECFFKLKNQQGYLIYVALILPITYIFSEVGGVITGFLRLVPLALLGVFLLFFDYKSFLRQNFFR